MKYPFILLTFLLICGSLAAQCAKTGWLSLQRLSLELSSGYYFSPWDNYNRAAQTIADRIMLDPYFYEPRGAYEKINGDLMYRGALGYRLFRGLRVSFTAQYSTSSAPFEMYPDMTVPPLNENTSPAFRQKFSLDVYSFGLAADYRYAVNRRISLVTNAGLDRFTGKLDFRFIYDEGATGPAGSGFGWRDVKARLDDNVLAWHAGLGLSFRLTGRISLQVMGEYRRLRFEGMEGPGTVEYWGSGEKTPAETINF
ncbi:MAG: hypothetical protein P8184_09930, partial [Calditrichia bacterium]